MNWLAPHQKDAKRFVNNSEQRQASFGSINEVAKNCNKEIQSQGLIYPLVDTYDVINAAEIPSNPIEVPDRSSSCQMNIRRLRTSSESTTSSVESFDIISPSECAASPLKPVGSTQEERESISMQNTLNQRVFGCLNSSRECCHIFSKSEGEPPVETLKHQLECIRMWTLTISWNKVTEWCPPSPHPSPRTLIRRQFIELHRDTDPKKWLHLHSYRK